MPAGGTGGMDFQAALFPASRKVPLRRGSFVATYHWRSKHDGKRMAALRFDVRVVQPTEPAAQQARPLISWR